MGDRCWVLGVGWGGGEGGIGMRAHTFLGYPRPDGRFGVRNHLAVVSSVACVNEVTRRIATEVGGAALPRASRSFR